jgi:hypothetical protein
MINIFKMDDYQWVISPWYAEDTHEWYLKECGLTEEDCSLDLVELDENLQGYWFEIDEDQISEYEKVENVHGVTCAWINREMIMEMYKEIDKPDMLCCTEW